MIYWIYICTSGPPTTTTTHSLTFTWGDVIKVTCPKGSMTQTGTVWGVPANCELWIANPSSYWLGAGTPWRQQNILGKNGQTGNTGLCWWGPLGLADDSGTQLRQQQQWKHWERLETQWDVLVILGWAAFTGNTVTNKGTPHLKLWDVTRVADFRSHWQHWEELVTHVVLSTSDLLWKKLNKQKMKQWS